MDHLSEKFWWHEILEDFRENIGYPGIVDEMMYKIKTGVNARGGFKKIQFCIIWIISRDLGDFRAIFCEHEHLWTIFAKFFIFTET